MRSQPSRYDETGTLWTLQHQAGTARCALVAAPHEWRVLLLIDEDVLQTNRCRKPDEVFALAESWKSRLMGLGWRAPNPAPIPHPKPDRRSPDRT